MKPVRVTSLLVLLTMLAACNFPASGSPSPIPERPPTLTSPPRPMDTVEAPSPESPTPGEPVRPEEAILILEPGPGSRLTSPVHVAGISDPTFEQTLAVRIVLDDGTELAAQPASIDAELGQRGPFEADIPFAVSGERQALIQVFDVSARDGGVVHLASVGVRLGAGGAQSIVPGTPHPEDLIIDQPAFGATVSGGVVHVEGFGLASFEGTLVIAVYDIGGIEIGSQPIVVNAPDMGLPGPFNADVPYTLTEAGPGRITVTDPLPVFNGINHVASVEVALEP
jgi:hypothetical protein